MTIIDSHHHIWDLEQFSYSWCSSIPSLNRSFSQDDYARAASGLNVGSSVFVEADVDEPFMLSEARWVSELSTGTAGNIAAIVAACRPEKDDFEQHLASLAQLPAVRGVRRVLHAISGEIMEQSIFRANLRSLATYNFSFDLCVRADQLPGALQLIRACPETQFVLDHCGNPRPNGPLEDWRQDVANIAACPNVVCKMSGIVVNGDLENWSVESLNPCFETVLEAFGPERLLWGSDWPVCNLASTFRGWLECSLELASILTRDEQTKLFYENARRVYRITS